MRMAYDEQGFAHTVSEDGPLQHVPIDSRVVGGGGMEDREEVLPCPCCASLDVSRGHEWMWGGKFITSFVRCQGCGMKVERQGWVQYPDVPKDAMAMATTLAKGALSAWNRRDWRKQDE